MDVFWIIVLIAAIFFQFILLKKNTSINNVFVLFIFVAFLMWYFVPIVLTLSGNTGIIEYLEISLIDYYNLAIKELILYFFIIFVFYISSSKRRIKLSAVKFVENENKKYDRRFQIFTIIFMIVYIVYIGFNRMDYVTNNEITNQQGGIFQLLTFFSYYFVAFLWILIIYGDSNNRRKIAIILIVAYTIVSVLSGSRILLLSIIYLLLFLVSRENNRIKKLKIYVVLVVVFLASLVALPFLSAQRSGVDAAVIIKSDNILTMAMEELNVKLNSIAYSAVLLKYDGEEFAGFKPYLGSIVKFVPRFIWTDKPAATSFNKDISGIPSRRIPVLLGVNSETYNTGTSTYAVAAWQMGIITVFITFILNVLLFKIINNCFNNSSFYIKSFGFMLMGFPQLIMLPSFGDNIVQKLIEAFVFFIVLLSFNYFKLIRENENNII